MEEFRQRLIDIAASFLHASRDQVAKQLRIPEPELGDIALPCFSFAKHLRRPPNQIARDLANHLDQEPGFSAAPAGPYVNVKIDPTLLVQKTIGAILERGADYGKQDLGKGGTVVIDFSSPNIAKPIAFHHIRSTLIGMALYRLYKTLGYEPIGINYLGDWGKQFGLLAHGFREFGDPGRLESEGIRYLVELYAEANLAAKGDPSKGVHARPGFDESARRLFSAMESGDPEVLDLWRRFREISLEEFDRIYRRLGVEFDFFEGESKYADVLDHTIERVKETVGVKVSQGALVADLDYGHGEPPLMLRKADGSTLYATRDLAAAMDRYERFKFVKSLYVVGAQQRLYFKQLFACLEAMGFEWARRCIHVSFGTVLKKKPAPDRPGGFVLERFATRRGEIVYLEEVLDEAVAKATNIMERTNPSLEDRESVAEQVGVAAVMFSELSHRRNKDVAIEVDENDEIIWEKLIDFRGQTGPYLQYAHARSCSILRKAGGLPSGRPDFSKLVHPAEQSLARELAAYPEDLVKALAEYEPAVLSDRLTAIARSVSHYYTLGNQDRGMKVLCDDAETRKARLALVEAVKTVLKSGLDILGIPSPERM